MRNVVSKVWGAIVRMFVALFPRDKHLIVYGGALDLFIDNAKHLFIYHNENFAKKYRHIWLTNNQKTYDEISHTGLSVVMVNSFRGIYTLLRAGFVIFDNSIDSFAYHNLSMGSVRICLWHGVGFKMVGVAVSDDQPVYQPKSWFYEKFLAKHVHGDYFFSTSEMRRPIYSFSFLIDINRVLVAGYPRMRCCFMADDERMNYISRYESKQFVDFYKQIACSKQRRIIYMPTFRDSNKNYIDEAIPDWNKLNNILRQSNAVMYLKVHRVTPMPPKMDFSNIVILNNSLDIYPLLPLFDLLISDYSSIMSDFAQLKKPMLFYTFDLQQYIENSRNVFKNFWTVYKQLPVVTGFEELLHFIKAGEYKYLPSDLERDFDKPKDFGVAMKLIEELS